jgi:hypothetical protein
MADGEDLELGVGKLITPLKNILPIVLLPLLRKLLSIIVLNRIRNAVDMYLSPAQSGFIVCRYCVGSSVACCKNYALQSSIVHIS